MGTHRRGSRTATATAVVGLLASLLVVASGTPPAAAAGEVVQFATAVSATPESATPNILVELTHTAPNDNAVVVSVTATPGTASPDDYYLSPSSIVFSPKSPSGSTLPVDLTFIPDDVYENSETLTLEIVSTSVGAIGTQSTHVATITNDDEAPTLSISDVTRSENNGPMVFTITRVGLTALDATAVATPTGITAEGGADFASAPGAISIPPGGAVNSDTFEIPLINEAIYEANETLSVSLSGLVAAQAGVIEATGTILNDDPIPTLSIDDVTVAESSGTATFTVTRSGETAFDTSFAAATSGVSATPGADFTAVAGSYNIVAGSTARTTTIVVPIINDDLDEDTETLTVALSGAAHAAITKAVGTAAISDDDTAGVTVDEGEGVFVLEGAAADTIHIRLTSEPTAPVTVTFSEPTDQVVVDPAEITFDASNWADAQTIAIRGVEDGIDEPDPHRATISLRVTSSDPDYNAFPLPPITATVGDADALLVTIDGPTVGTPGSPATFSASVNAGGLGNITYDWTAFYLGNQVAGGTDPTFRFTPANGGLYNIQVIIGDDQGQNPAEFIQFRALGDVAGSVFAADIVWLAGQGITKGCNPPENTLFCPFDPVTRGQMAAFLVRFLGLANDGGGNTFVDDDNSIFENDIAKLAAAGITQGCNPPTNDRFCPTDPVTREQMAAFLVRALDLTDDGGGNTFTDDDNSIFEADIAKLAASGITRGCNPPTNDRFCPTDPVTREQMAAFIRRAAGVAND